MFELKASCLIEHVNNRRGKNEDSLVNIDLKLSIDVLPAECAMAALAARGEGEVQQAFFRGDEPRFSGCKVFPIEREYEGKHMLRVNDLPGMRVVKLFNIKLEPTIAGHFSATFTATVEDPSPEWLHKVSNWNNTSVDIDLEQDVRELDLADKPADGKAPGKVKKSDRHAEQPGLH